jgi:putative ABC transport system substrate-binding protein
MGQVKRRQFLVAASALLVAPRPRAQPVAKVARVGFLGNSDRSTLANYLEVFNQELRELGYIEGRNISIEYRWAEGKYARIPSLVNELVRLKVDAIVTEGSVATQAARKATSTIPIVMAQVGDPVGSGFIQSLAHPGANVTGVTTLSLGLVGKQMELLKEIVPGLGRVAVLWNPDHPGHPRAMPDIKAAARRMGLNLQLVEVRNLDELNVALAGLARKRPSALTAVSEPIYDSQQKRIAEFAVQNGIASAYTKAFADMGGLMSYGARFDDLFRLAAVVLDKIIKGAKPADLPVEQPTKFELIINLKTARTLGLKIPQSVLLRADRVIE